MRVLVLADAMFATRERALLQRLEIGLADEGVQVIQAVPESIAGSMDEDVFAQSVAYTPRSQVLTQGIAVRRLIRSLGALDELETPRDIDMVHVFGGAAWDLAGHVAQRVEAGLLLEVWRSGLVERASELSPLRRTLLMAPDPVIEQQLLRKRPREAVRLAPWGVLSADPRPVLTGERALAFMIVGAGRDAQAFARALQGLGPVLRDHPDALVFCDAAAARRSELWPVARSLDLLHRVSLVQDLEGRRDLVLHGDVLILPEASGEQRSIVLEAMSAGLVVVAARDPGVSTLVDGRTARLVEPTTPKEWDRVVRDVLHDPDASRALAQRAHHMVASERKASGYLRCVLEAYEALRAK
jgi:hypothetical protein